MDVPPVIDGTVLISESDLEGVESGDGTLNPYESFRNVRPVAIIEDGVYVYHGRFAVPLAAAWVDVHKSGELAKAGHAGEALAMAQEAVELAPNSAKTQLNLADLLAAQGQWSDARTHYQMAETALNSNRPDLEAEELQGPIEKGLQQAEALQ
jgi:tetratricopeptide (TPR) repeat protein